MTLAQHRSRLVTCALALLFGLGFGLGPLPAPALAAGAPAPPAASAPPAAPWQDRFLTAPPSEVLAAARARPTPPDATIEVLLEEQVVRFESDGRATTRFRQVYRVLAEPEDEWRVTGTHWETWHEEHPQLRARVITPDAQAHLLDPATIENRGPTGTDPEIYDDARIVRAPLPGVGPGALVELEIEKTERAPRFDAGTVHRYFFASSVPLGKARLVLDAPASLPLKFITHGRGIPQPVSTLQGGRRVHTFEGGPYPALPPLPPGAPPEAQLPPYIGYTTGESWAGIATRYAAIALDKLRDVHVGPRVEDAVRGASGRQDQIARLVAALRRDVRYTGVEFGEASIVPRTPAAVLERRYGDCKDMALLLVAELRALGIEAHLALLNAGFTPDVDEDLPGFGFFNHAIVYVPGVRTPGTQASGKPAAPVLPPIWIDPSARFTPAGELPPQDQGRRALIAAAGTTALVKTPLAPPAQNLVREQREIQITEDGTARIHERNEWHGASAAQFRASYSETARSTIEKQLSDYARRTYGAPSLKHLAWSEPTDLSRPFSLEFMAEGATPATVDDEGAVLYLNLWALLGQLPETLRGSDDDTQAPPESSPRSLDYVYPVGYRHELEWRVVPPHGYLPEPSPAPRHIPLGPASLELTFQATPDGTATAVARFDSGRTRLTPAEFATVKKALRDLKKSPAPALRFVQTGQAHLAAGRIREALTEFRRLQTAHPEAVLHASQIARAYLAAGLGEAARHEAEKAVAAAPRSLDAQLLLGWVREHDLLGRRLMPGADRAGAERAYRQALTIDPKAEGARASLAILFEHDPQGGHTFPPERLADAITQYEALYQAGVSRYALNHAIALFRLERFSEAITVARRKGDTLEAHALVIAATKAGTKPDTKPDAKADETTAAALRELQALVPAASKRPETLRLAGHELIQVRHYAAASALLAEAAARGHEDGATLRGQATVLAHLRRSEDLPIDRRDPKSVALATLAHLVVWSANNDPRSLATLRTLLVPAIAQELDRTTEWRRGFLLGMRNKAPQGGQWPVRVIADVLRSAEASVEGQPRSGYRVQLANWSEDAPSRFIVVPRSDGYRVLVLPGSGEALLGGEALRLGEAGDLDGARQMLDWAVDGAWAGTSEEPLSGVPLRRLWTPGTRGDAATIRCAAQVARATASPPDATLPPLLTRCRDGATTETAKLAIEQALLDVLRQQEHWTEALALAKGLLARYPQSRAAYFMNVLALHGAGRTDEARTLLEERLAREPDSAPVQEVLANLATEDSDVPRREDLLRRLAAAPHPSSAVLNNLAWSLITRGAISEETLTIARRAAAINQRKSAAVLHTLATALAELGHPEEAMQTLRESLERDLRDAPGRSDWYVIGRAAEAYGAKEAALDAYRHIEHLPKPEPFDIEELVARRRQQLASP